MAKGRSSKVEEQKGPLSMKEQLTQKFMGYPERAMRDIENAALRRSGQTLTAYEPKK